MSEKGKYLKKNLIAAKMFCHYSALGKEQETHTDPSNTNGAGKKQDKLVKCNVGNRYFQKLLPKLQENDGGIWQIIGFSE